ncbi:MAG: peptidylprolyl isomerase [Synechococcales bacterium]|nr:peptidylprolyl isomerase [Synechococcales bacterium]
MQFKEVCQRLISQNLIEQTAQEQGIEVEAVEIQAEGDAQRRQRRLENAKDTYSWLVDQMVTPDQWEAGIRDRLLAKKLAQHLFEHQVEAYFVEHRLEFEQVSLYRLVVPYELLAQELFYRIEEGEISFYEAAHLYDVDGERRSHCGYEGRPHRWALSPQIAAIIFSARVGEVIGPIQSEQGYDLLRVEEFIAAELTDDIRQIILNRLFQSWLESELPHFLAQHAPVS